MEIKGQPMGDLPFNIPSRFETDRLILRCYEPGDRRWFHAMCRRNRSHLMQYESDNFILEVDSEERAESILAELIKAW